MTGVFKTFLAIHPAAPRSGWIDSKRCLEKIKRVSETLGDVFWEWNGDSGSLFWSESLCALLETQIEPQGFSYSNFESRVLPQDRTRFKLDLQNAIERKESVACRQYRIETQLQKTIEVFERILISYHSSGYIMKMTGHLTKLSRPSQRSQNYCTTDVSEVAYIVSHDVNGPLRSMASYLSLIKREYPGKILDERGLDFLEFAIGGVNRLKSIVDDLLGFALVGRESLPEEWVNCSLLVNEVIRDIQFLVNESGAKIEVNPLPFVQGNSTQLRQLFQNLITNAIKFRSEHRPLQIAITVEETDSSWIFTVKDNGIGFSVEDSVRIFHVFERLNRKKCDGTGMGLSICKKIVESRGGRIWAKSIPGAGSTFFFQLTKQNRD